MLLAARALQGVGGAMASPAVLALIVSSFPEGKERTRALGIYMGVITGGSSLGLVLGGIITEWLSWRWVLFINIPIGVAVVAITPLFVGETIRQPGRFDVVGAVTSTAGVSALVYGFIRASANGWGDHLGLGAFGLAAVLLALFIVNETRVVQPITPLRLFADVSRSGSFAARLLLIAGMFGVFFFLTQFLQRVMGFSALRAGVAFLPMTLALFGVSRLAPRLMPRLGVKPMMVAGLIPVIVAMAWLSRVSMTSGYWADVAARRRVRPGLRAADHHLAGRSATEGLRGRLRHAQHAAAGRRVTRPCRPGGRVRHGEPGCAPAPGRRIDAARSGAACARARHRLGVPAGRDP
jgi:MFS family permease